MTAAALASTAYDRVVDALDRHGCRIPRDRGTQTQAQCPAHHDGSPSLSVKRIDGSVLIHCHAGCEVEAILDVLGLNKADLYDDPRGATYQYTDTTGAVVRNVHRTPDKQFRQTGHDNTKPTTLYRLPDVVAAVGRGDTVYLVEGEKDVHALETLGVVATTAPMGASSFTKVDPSPLNGAHIVAVVDRDDRGNAWATDVAEHLEGTTQSLRFVTAAEGKDAADHIAAGHHLEDLLEHEPSARSLTPRLPTFTTSELRAMVAARGPRKWLLRGYWPAGDYGVHAAAPKGQKTMNTTDLAVAVASGTPWLGLVEVDAPGPVLMFVGEGGDGNTLRRLDAAAEARGLSLDDLPIHVCTKAPHIGNSVDLTELAHHVETIQPSLVTLDPLYLSARGAELGDIYKMGALLEGPQRICQGAGAALWVVHHFNRQAGSGAGRMSGAGPQEWGRVLATSVVKSRRTDPETRATTVVTEIEFAGGEIPDQKLRLVRTTSVDDPDDLDSPMHVENTATYADDSDTDSDEATAGSAQTKLKPSQRRLLNALDALNGPSSIKQIGDWMADNDAPPLRRETCSKAFTEMAEAGLVDSIPGEQFQPTQWFRTTPRDQRDVTRDDHATDPSVTSVTAPIGGHTSRGHTSHHPDHTTQGHAELPLDTTTQEAS